jgi:hypothetical protein
VVAVGLVAFGDVHGVEGADGTGGDYHADVAGFPGARPVRAGVALGGRHGARRRLFRRHEDGRLVLRRRRGRRRRLVFKDGAPPLIPAHVVIGAIGDGFASWHRWVTVRWLRYVVGVGRVLFQDFRSTIWYTSHESTSFTWDGGFRAGRCY